MANERLNAQCLDSDSSTGISNQAAGALCHFVLKIQACVCCSWEFIHTCAVVPHKGSGAIYFYQILPGASVIGILLFQQNG